MDNPKTGTRTPFWFAIAGAGMALLATALNPLLASVADAQFHSFLYETTKYLIFSTGFFLLFWLLLSKPLARRKLSRKPWPKPSQVGREALFSVCTQVIFIAIDIWMAYVIPSSNANKYTSISEYGWAYYGFVIILVFFAHDTYFYWMHRLIHHPKLYDPYHRVHHESTDPTPYSAFHFHPVEAIGEGLASGLVLLIFMLIPWHASVPVVWAFGQLTFNVIGHLGYEIYPSWWHRVPILKWKTPAMHHYLHHQMVGGNYALYFVACEKR